MRLTLNARQDLKELSALLRHTERACWAFAVYNTSAIRDVALKSLQRLIKPIPIFDFTFSSNQRNPLAYLDTLPPKARERRAVIIFFDVERADDKVFGILETQRETFAAHPHSLVFWTTPGGRVQLARKAPNFWAQRSGTFDFTVKQEDEAVNDKSPKTQTLKVSGTKRARRNKVKPARQRRGKNRGKRVRKAKGKR